MTPQQIIDRMPYPIAAVYAALDDPKTSLQLRQEALGMVRPD